jgi:DNA-binding IclR family transcriptional regulator
MEQETPVSQRQDVDRYSVPSVRDACQVLKLLAQHPEGFGVTEIADRLEISRTTAIRIVRTLERETLLIRKDSSYCCGPGLIQLGLQSLSSVNVRNASLPILKELVQKTGETAHLAELCGDKSLLLEVSDSAQALRVAQRPGSLADLHCSATGKVFIAHCLRDPIPVFFSGKKLEKRTVNTLTGVRELQAEAERVREQGYGMDDEEYHIGVRCLAAPIRNAHGVVIAAIGITGATTRVTREKVPTVVRDVIAAAEQISTAIGGQ